VTGVPESQRQNLWFLWVCGLILTIAPKNHRAATVKKRQEYRRYRRIRQIDKKTILSFYVSMYLCIYVSMSKPIANKPITQKQNLWFLWVYGLILTRVPESQSAATVKNRQENRRYRRFR